MEENGLLHKANPLTFPYLTSPLNSSLLSHTKFSIIPFSFATKKNISSIATPPYIIECTLVHFPICIGRQVPKHSKLSLKNKKEREEMSADWGPVIVSVVLFILLSPGLLFQLPARTRVIEFGNMCTSGIAILVHAVIYFCIITILMVAIGIHIHIN
ncbi:hypothetical protein V6Z12_A07G264400 [Gossypium hirsutum]|uniref:Transmembrane protein n=8 Tax=Gossypium TaxID=3633 RepID=A0ABM3C0H9_GOSHI|nr:uncharacterized protein LOC107937123 [Gossypium hirsutum]